MHCNNLPNCMAHAWVEMHYYEWFQYNHNLISQVYEYPYVSTCMTYETRWYIQHNNFYLSYLNDKDVSMFNANFQSKPHEKMVSNKCAHTIEWATN